MVLRRKADAEVITVGSGRSGQASALMPDARMPLCPSYRPEQAWACCDYTSALRQRNGDGDRQRAVSLLGESLVIAGELGRRRLEQKNQKGGSHVNFSSTQGRCTSSIRTSSGPSI